MNSQSGVAVITRTKNRVLLLERAVRSVLDQTFKDWQHIVVNDGGEPQSVDDLLKKYENGYGGRLTVIHNPQSLGMEGASNAGIKASASKYVVIHDDDDSWEPEFLERCIREYEHCPFSTVKGVVTHMTQIFERIEGDSVIEERRQIYDPELVAISLPQISEINRFLPISFLFERSVLDEIGLFDENLPVIGDWEFNIRYFMKYDVLVVKEALANYHVRTNAAPEYENTVTAGSDAHLFHRALMVNKHIRDDLENGRLSKGALLFFGDYFYRTSSGSARIGRVIDRLKGLSLVSFLRRLFKR